MTLMGLLVILIVAALLLWATRTILPVLGLPASVQTIVYVAIVVFVVLWLLNGLTGLGTMRLWR